MTRLCGLHAAGVQVWVVLSAWPTAVLPSAAADCSLSSSNASLSARRLAPPSITAHVRCLALLRVSHVTQAEKENAEIRLDDPAKYQSIVDAE
jgi:hypothetical protein